MNKKKKLICAAAILAAALVCLALFPIRWTVDKEISAYLISDLND